MRTPKLNVVRPGADKSKWCKYHKIHRHLTEDCVHIKDAIETWIKEGRLSKYTKRSDASRREVRDANEPEEDKSPDPGPVQVALYVSRPEYFLPSEELDGALSHWEKFPTTMVISNGDDFG